MRQSSRSFARLSTVARTLVSAGAKAGLATSLLVLVLEIAEASVRAAHVEAVCVFRTRARIRAASRGRIPRCPRRLATPRGRARASMWASTLARAAVKASLAAFWRKCMTLLVTSCAQIFKSVKVGRGGSTLAADHCRSSIALG